MIYFFCSKGFETILSDTSWAQPTEISCQRGTFRGFFFRVILILHGEKFASFFILAKHDFLIIKCYECMITTMYRTTETVTSTD